MHKFTKHETKGLMVIFLILFVVITINMLASLRKGRDSIRKNDISAIQNALDTYFQKYRVYPAATLDGQIVGCFEGGPQIDKISGYPTNAVECSWGDSKFEDLLTMPQDPNYEKGAAYLYKSDGQNYEFYVALEGHDEAEYTQAIANKNLHCGSQICNYGRGNKF